VGSSQCSLEDHQVGVRRAAAPAIELRQQTYAGAELADSYATAEEIAVGIDIRPQQRRVSSSRAPAPEAAREA